MYRIGRFLVILLIHTSFACSVNEPVVKADDENQFWNAFREALLNDNVQKIMSLTHFPFEVRGPGYSQAVKNYEAKDFPAIFQQLTDQLVYYPSAGGMSSKPMRQLIEEKRQVTPGDFITPDLIQFVQFEFERINDRWFFTRAYLEE